MSRYRIIKVLPVEYETYECEFDDSKWEIVSVFERNDKVFLILKAK